MTSKFRNHYNITLVSIARNLRHLMGPVWNPRNIEMKQNFSLALNIVRLLVLEIHIIANLWCSLFNSIFPCWISTAWHFRPFVFSVRSGLFVYWDIYEDCSILVLIFMMIKKTAADSAKYTWTYIYNKHDNIHRTTTSKIKPCLLKQCDGQILDESMYTFYVFYQPRFISVFAYVHISSILINSVFVHPSFHRMYWNDGKSVILTKIVLTRLRFTVVFFLDSLRKYSLYMYK